MQAGTRLGPYEIVSRIGAGGMGEVWRARDTRLDRTVAIKTLPAEFASDAMLKIRFDREAKAISALNHPHICTLFDVGTDYFVMEHCEGKSLAAQLSGGALPVDRVVEYGIQIADALGAAHRAGIVHRDLKPANVMVTRSGIKVLDFGLAIHAETVSADDATVEKLTGPGDIVGTLQYMAPEVLQGHEADARSDIFALGLVLYEMATGKPAFSGTNRASLIAAILDREPAPVVELRPDAPASLSRLIRACLEKDPDRRMQSAHDVLLQLQWIGEPEAPRKKKRTGYAVAAVALIVVGVVAGIGWKTIRGAKTTIRPSRFEIQPPAGVSVRGVANAVGIVAISPDGEWVAYAGTNSNGEETALYVRKTRSLQPEVVIRGSTGASFFSPDSKWLGYFLDGALWKVAVQGGEPTRLCNVARVRGASWGEDGTIVFSDRERLWRVSAEGGDPRPLTNPHPPERHAWPQILPGGRYVLLTLNSTIDRLRKIAILSLADGKIEELVSGSYPRYAAGQIIYAHYGKLYALPFDATKNRATGRSRVVLDNVGSHLLSGYAAFDLAADGSLVYIPGAPRLPDAELVWIDRRGQVTSAFGEKKPYGAGLLSPDGKRIAVTISQTVGEADLWTVDLERSLWTRLTSGLAAESNFNWSPDGTRIVFPSLATPSGGHLYEVRVDGSASARQLTSTEARDTYASFSSDGSMLIFERQPRDSEPVLMVMPSSGGTPRAFFASSAAQNHPSFSPDGKWVAYESTEIGGREVHVRPFPGPEPRVTVSAGGGQAPFWSHDGRELFFRKGKELWSASVTTTAGFHASAPRQLFTAEFLNAQPWGDRMTVSLDGTRFLTVRASTDTRPNSRIVYAPDWLAEAKQEDH